MTAPAGTLAESRIERYDCGFRTDGGPTFRHFYAGTWHILPCGSKWADDPGEPVPYRLTCRVRPISHENLS